MKKIYLVLTLFSVPAFAGSFAPLLEEFKISSSEKVEALKPEFVVSSIERGSDDGNFASTSDAGVITLQLKNAPAIKQDHIFEIVEGAFEDQLFSKNAVVPTEFIENQGQYTFIWLDGSNDVQEPFNIRVKIVGVSSSGDLSEPQYLKITHQGATKPWWKIW